jgi:hypothetical protein
MNHKRGEKRGEKRGFLKRKKRIKIDINQTFSSEIVQK